jgi:large subunit ribosomal protein L21
MMSKIAVIKTGGKQYLVREGDILKIEKIDGKVGGKAKFDQILLLTDEGGKEIKIGKPTISGVKIEGKILEQGRAKKILVIKYKRKIRYKKKKGHRQFFTKVKIEKID